MQPHVPALILSSLIIVMLCLILGRRAPPFFKRSMATLSSLGSVSSITWPPRPESFPHMYLVDNGVYNCTKKMSGEHRPFTQCDGVDLQRSFRGKRIVYYPSPKGPMIANFRTTHGVLETGYIGIVINHIPYIPNNVVWNAVWLMSASLPPNPFCEIDIFEMMGLWWEKPKFSVHSSAGCGAYGHEEGLCGLYINDCPEGDCHRPDLPNRVRVARKGDKANPLNFADGHWTQRYNEFCAKHGPVTWAALVERSRILVGYALGEWKPSRKPSAAEFIKRCTFVVEFHDGVHVPGHMHLLINSTYEHEASTLDEAYWEIPSIVIHADAAR